MLEESLFTFDQVRRSRELGGRHFTWVAWDLLRRNARLYGGREAFVDTFLGLSPELRRRRTWQEAYRQVNVLIFQLLRLGLRKGATVLSQLPAVIESTYLDLATSKLGAMHCGLNLDLGERETLGIIDKLRPDVAVIVPEWRGRDLAAWYRRGQERLNGRPVLFALLRPGEACPEGMRPLSELFDEAGVAGFGEEDLAYLRTDPLDVHELLPTGGTTGVPKVSRRTTLDWFHVHSVCIAERAGHTVYDRRLLIGPLSGGSGRLWGVHVPLYTGGASVYLTEFDEEAAFRLTVEEDISLWVWNPSLITRLVTHPAFEEGSFPRLRQVSYSGAPMAGEVLERLLDRGIIPFNVYGTSEVGGCMSPILPGTSLERLRQGAGVPFEGFDVPVVDAEGNRLPPGEVGEILIWNVHHGYVADPEESRAAFADTAYGGRWDGYQHTGDLGVYDEAGYLRVVGRKKDMILRGGQNIFPKEIEDLLSEHPSVRDIAVVAMPDPVLGERVCAYVVPQEGQEVRVEDLAEFLRTRGVARFKWPERVEIVASLPLGPGGKVRKDVLREDIARKLAEEQPS